MFISTKEELSRKVAIQEEQISRLFSLIRELDARLGKLDRKRIDPE